MALITITQAKDHLRVEHTDHDSRLLLRMDEATDIVIDYIKRPDHGWTDLTVPPLVRAAILLACEGLYTGDADPLSDTVKNLLHRYRDPALA